MEAGSVEVKFAVTEVFEPTVNVQFPNPEQPPPLQPKKLAPEPGWGDNVTVVPLAKVVEHVDPQSMPAGELCTFPLPFLFTTRLAPCGEKVAVTDLLLVIDTAQVPVPEHAPLQPVKMEPADAVAVKFTEAPLEYTSEQSAPHEIPAGELVTEPLPVPKLVTFFTRLTDSVKV